MEEEKKIELNDDALEEVVGGINDATLYLSERDDLPADYYVTCARCITAFPFGMGKCPCCGSKKAWYGKDRAHFIYDPNLA